MGTLMRITLPYVCLIFFFIQADSNRVVQNSNYFPTELINVAGKFTLDEIKSFVHTASFIQNSNVLGLEAKVPGFNVLNEMKRFQQSKVGEYCRTLLRMWAKFGPQDRIRHKDEVYKNIDALKIPEGFKSAVRGLFEHIDNLQKVVINATNCALTTTTTTTTTRAVIQDDGDSRSVTLPSFGEFETNTAPPAPTPFAIRSIRKRN